jgi:hypothetical protein
MTRANLQTTSTHSPAQQLFPVGFNPTFKAAMKNSIQLQDMEHDLQRLQENLPEAERRIFERLLAERDEEAQAEIEIGNDAEAMLRQTNSDG